MEFLQRRVNGFFTSAMPSVEESTRMAADLLRDETERAEFRCARPCPRLASTGHFSRKPDDILIEI